MNVEFRMPDIGEGIAEVELLEWHVQVGTQVHEYETLATIQTDKSIVEMPSPVTGTVTRLGPKEGDMLPVGDVLVVFDTGEDATAQTPPTQATRATAPTAAAPPAAAPTAAAPTAAAPPAAAPLAPAEAASQTAAGANGSAASRPRAAPTVRRLAAELGIDLAAVAGSGPGGRISREDVQRAAAAGAAPPEAAARTGAATAIGEAPGDGQAGQHNVSDAGDERVPVRGLRRQIAKKMVESWRTVPHITDWRECDARQLIQARRDLLAYRPDLASALTYVPFFVKITATALRGHPLLNASFDEAVPEYVLHRRINIGVATATDDGLLVPVVRDADRKSIAELAAEIAHLVEVTRQRKATLEQLSGGTYTVNNIGAIGGHMGTPIIRTPEVGILAFGRIADRVVAVDGSPVVRPTIMISSVGDHRLHDGDTLGAFTSAVVQLVEHPYALLGELR